MIWVASKKLGKTLFDSCTYTHNQDAAGVVGGGVMIGERGWVAKGKLLKVLFLPCIHSLKTFICFVLLLMLLCSVPAPSLPTRCVEFRTADRVILSPNGNTYCKKFAVQAQHSYRFCGGCLALFERMHVLPENNNSSDSETTSTTLHHLPSTLRTLSSSIST